MNHKTTISPEVRAKLKELFQKSYQIYALADECAELGYEITRDSDGIGEIIPALPQATEEFDSLVGLLGELNAEIARF